MIDPADFNVISGTFRSIAAEMGDVLLHSAHSSIVREARDCSTCLTDAAGYTVAQAEMIPIHMNSLAAAFDFARRKYDLTSLAPEEALITNNPYEQGQHLNDIILVLPVFHDGELSAFTGTVVHHLEVGGAVAGSNADARDIFQEGLTLPTMRINLEKDLYGGPVEQILAANVRLPKIVIGDFHAQISALLRGRTLMQEMFKRYGMALIRACMSEMQDYSERVMRSVIAELPDGTYYGEDVLDGNEFDEPMITVRAEVTIRGSDVSVDLSASDDQVYWPVNAPIASAQSAVLTAFGALVGPGVPTNAGTYRPIQVVTRKGSLLDPIHPAPVRARMTSAYRVLTAVRRALCDAIPNRMVAAGSDSTNMITFSYRDETGLQMFTENVSGGNGASAFGDGADAIAQGLSNTGNTPIESIEMDHDFIRLTSYELVQDSGGAGQQQGGLGVRRCYEVLKDDVLLSTNGDRHRGEPYGVAGGGKGSLSSYTLYRGNEIIRLPAARITPVRKGDRFVVEISGGGGYGAPAARDRAAVAQDLEQGRISHRVATEIYGLAPEDVAGD